jgi:hypothetical protein
VDRKNVTIEPATLTVHFTYFDRYQLVTLPGVANLS